MSSQSDNHCDDDAQREFINSMASMTSGGWISHEAFREATGHSYPEHVQKKKQRESASYGCWYGQMSYDDYESEYQKDTPEERAQMIAYYAEQDRRNENLRLCANADERAKLLAHYAELDKQEDSQ